MIELALILDDGSPAWTKARPGGRPPKLLGLTTAGRTVLAAHRAGVKRFWILKSGDGRSPFTRGERDVFLKKGIRVEETPVSSLVNPSGLRDEIQEDFFFIDGNTVLEPKTLTALASGRPAGGWSVFAREGSGRKEAAVFLCAPDVLSHWAGLDADDMMSRPWPALTEAILKSSDARQVDPGGAVVLRVRSKRDFREAGRSLVQTARKPNDGTFARQINRPISLFISRFLLKANVRPLPVTLVNLIVGLGSCWFTAMGTPSSFTLGAILFMAANIFDGCDGEIARLTFSESRLGGNLDMLGDGMATAGYFLSLPIGLYNLTQNPLYPVLGGVMVLLTANYYLQISRFMRKTGSAGNIVRVVKDIQSPPPEAGSLDFWDRLAARIAFAFRRDFMAFVVLALVPPGGVRILMGWAVVECLLGSSYLTAFTRKRLRQLNLPS